MQQESGYPYVINIDTVNAANPIHGKVISSNLCSEILQVQKASEIDNEQQYVTMGSDVSCNLGSTNIVNMMATARNIERAVRNRVYWTYTVREYYFVIIALRSEPNSIGIPSSRNI